jgi:DNA-directed RNA polymerase subunit M/transcription elongation factor TFIIS
MTSVSRQNKFCKVCNNLLGTIIKDNKLMFECYMCVSTYDADPNDSVRYYEDKCVDLELFVNILKVAHRDPANPKAYRDCPKCKHNVCRQVEIGNDMSLYNACIKCQYKWADK